MHCAGVWVCVCVCVRNWGEDARQLRLQTGTRSRRSAERRRQAERVEDGACADAWIMQRCRWRRSKASGFGRRMRRRSSGSSHACPPRRAGKREAEVGGDVGRRGEGGFEGSVAGCIYLDWRLAKEERAREHQRRETMARRRVMGDGWPLAVEGLCEEVRNHPGRPALVQGFGAVWALLGCCWRCSCCGCYHLMQDSAAAVVRRTLWLADRGGSVVFGK